MSNAFTRNLTERNATPQTEKARADQVANNAGGYVFGVGPKARLERFLMLGVDKGTYYVKEQDLFKQNLDFLRDLIVNDPDLYLQTVADVSTTGRAYRNSPAVFALAYTFQHGSVETKQTAKALVPQIARTGTMLYEFTNYLEKLGGWGRSKTGAVKYWFASKDVDALAYQAVKYRQRDGWTLTDVMRLGHPKDVARPVDKWILGKDLAEDEYGQLPEVVQGFELAQKMTSIEGVVETLRRYPILPWEAVPTQFHKDVELWKTLFYNNALNGQALLRNVVRLARLNAFQDMQFASDYADKLLDVNMMRRTKLHPVQYLLALVTYESGQAVRDFSRMREGAHWVDGVYRVKDWTTVPVIVDALNQGFYASFGTITPANKKTLIGLDVSGSMSSAVLGLDLSCAQVGAAMSMSIARTEPFYDVRGFADTFKDLGITPNQSLSEVMRRVQMSNFGRTDCGLPMQYAIENKIDVDTFVVMTDNETYAGRHGHPYELINKYRQTVGHDAKLIVMGMTATDFTIADPRDPGMLDICGVDAAVPSLVSNFSAGR